MGSANATVTATYKNLPPPATYTLSVNNGTGSGQYEAGTSVSISADPPATGKVFDKWTGGNGGTFADANSSSTSFTMPANTASVTATYKDDIPDGVEQVGGSEIIVYSEGSSLIVKSAVEMTAIEVYSASGQLVRKMSLNGFEIRIDNLPIGVLLVRISHKGGKIETKKIIK
jgi:uncharacterized repeat protein (TIGR02543 family)